jgi:hypothetical protein
MIQIDSQGFTNTTDGIETGSDIVFLRSLTCVFDVLRYVLCAGDVQFVVRRIDAPRVCVEKTQYDVC